MIVENDPVRSLKSDGVDERAIQSVQGVIWTIHRDINVKWRVKVDATHSVWPSN